MAQRNRSVNLKPGRSRAAHPNAAGIDIGSASHFVAVPPDRDDQPSDVLDCQWLQQLMTYGLLSGAFRPADAVFGMRSLWRQRGMLLRAKAARCSTCKRRSRR